MLKVGVFSFVVSNRNIIQHRSTKNDIGDVYRKNIAPYFIIDIWTHLNRNQTILYKREGRFISVTDATKSVGSTTFFYFFDSGFMLFLTKVCIKCVWTWNHGLKCQTVPSKTDNFYHFNTGLAPVCVAGRS